MDLTAEKNKSSNNNRKINCSGNKSFFTPCKRIGLSRKIASTSKKLTTADSPSSPCNTIVSASESTWCNLEKNKISKNNKSLGLIRKNAVFSSNRVQLSESATLRKSECGQFNNNEQCTKEKLLSNTEEVVLQELTEKESISEITASSYIYNESEKSMKPTIAKKENEVFKGCDKKEKIKTTSKSSRKRLGSFFSTKTSSATSDSEDDFIFLVSSSQRSKSSEKSPMGNLLQSSITIQRSESSDQNKENKKQQHKCELDKSKKKRKKDMCSSNEEEFEPILKKSTSKSIFSFSDTDCEKLKKLNENVCAIVQQIKEKERILTELRLVETYKKLHNVDKLENSINIWRRGFKEALADLHSELKACNPDSSISSLLNKLLIPESVRKSCSFTQE